MDYEAYDGVCPECDGYFACRCGEDEYPECYDEEDYGPDYDPDDEPVKCPCCGFEADPAEYFYPYCSNKCSKYSDE